MPPRRRTRKASKPSRTPTASELASLGAPQSYSPAELQAVREVFWHNIAREMLSGLAVLAQEQPDLFDGRFAVLTRAGERIPIGSVTPVFAVSVPGKGPEHDASLAVQCTVFRIQTPDGEVFTLPVQEIRAMHALTPELIDRMQAAAEARRERRRIRHGVPEDDEVREPFGLAAFTALPKHPPFPAPEHPTE